MTLEGVRALRVLVVSIAVVVLNVGCRSSFQANIVQRPELRVTAVAVYPFGFRWEEPAYRSFELSQRLLGVAMERATDRALFFGPSEFKIFRPEDNSAWAATNLATLLPELRLRPDVTWVLRPWAEKRSQSQKQALLDDKGRTRGVGVVEEVTYVGHVELVHPTSREVVVELVGQVNVDPFADRSNDSGADPLPELTTLMEGLTREALKAVDAQLSPLTTPKAIAWKTRFIPGVVVEPTVSAMDAVESQLLLENRVRFANPGLTDAEVSRLIKLPGGLLLLADVPSQGLVAGDVVLTVDGRPALPQVLERARFSPAPAQLKVRRAGGDTVETALR